MKRRKQFVGLLFLMIIASIFETVSIGAIIPFLGILVSPERVFSNPVLQPFFNFLGLSEPQELFFPITVAFSIAAVLAGLTRVALLWANTRLSFFTGADLSGAIYRKTLYQPFSVHINRNGSEVINAITKKTTDVIYGAILPVVQVISSTVILLAILGFFLWISPLYALAIIGGFGALYLVIAKLAKAKLLADGERVARESSKVIKVLQEGLGGIRDVIIDGAQPFYYRVYRDSDLSLRLAQGNNVFLSQAPRLIFEAIGMVLIVALAYVLSGTQGLEQSLPLLGALAMAAQRGLPVLQLGYVAWTSLQGIQASLVDVLEMLDQDAPELHDAQTIEPLTFRRCLEFEGVEYRYGEGLNFVIDRLNLRIKKGQRIGLIGKSGGGKSTFLDLLMGLLFPTAGRITVDGVELNDTNRSNWQANIAHVPQDIFLADSSISENIAFAIPPEKIDHERVRISAKGALIDSAIEDLPAKYQTYVGERGVRLSGGQRQRIGIARALYKRANVIVFDEATSALDTETENAVIETIQSLGKDITVIMVSHNQSSLEFCDELIEIDRGKIIKETNTTMPS